MMIAHVIYTAIQHITPSGVLRHVESRLIAALGSWIPQFGVVTVYAASPPTGPFAVAKHIAPTRYVLPL